MKHLSALERGRAVSKLLRADKLQPYLPKITPHLCACTIEAHAKASSAPHGDVNRAAAGDPSGGRGGPHAGAHGPPFLILLPTLFPRPQAEAGTPRGAYC
jgi:hypothetical protein